MKENEPPVPFAKVDATVESELAQRYDVTGYPTLKIFRNGVAHDYKGPRVENGKKLSALFNHQDLLSYICFHH